MNLSFQIWNDLKLDGWVRQWKNKITDVYHFKQTPLTVWDVWAVDHLSHVFERFPSCLAEHKTWPTLMQNPFLPLRKPTHVFFLGLFFLFGVKLNVTLQVMMPTVAFPSPGSWSADRLRSAAEFPCHVRLAADVCASYSHCEDKQVGRGGCCLWAREVAVKALQSAQAIPCAVSVDFLAKPAAAVLGVFRASQATCGRKHMSGGQKDCEVAMWFLHEFSGCCFCLCKLHDCKIPALDLAVTSFRAESKCMITFGVRCCLAEEN